MSKGLSRAFDAVKRFVRRGTKVSVAREERISGGVESGVESRAPKPRRTTASLDHLKGAPWWHAKRLANIAMRNTGAHSREQERARRVRQRKPRWTPDGGREWYAAEYKSAAIHGGTNHKTFLREIAMHGSREREPLEYAKAKVPGMLP